MHTLPPPPPLRMYPDTNHKPHATSKDLCLLEVWNGCLNPLPHCKRVSSVLGGWGYLEEERKKVKLMVVSRSKLWSSVVAKQRVKRYVLLSLKLMRKLYSEL